MMKVAACAPLALMLASAPVVSADTIYDNTINQLGYLLSARETERGDGATLAGTDRVVTRLSLIIVGNDGDHPADVTVRLYEGGDEEFNPPGAMLWQSELFLQMNILEGSNLYDFDVPSVPVPDGVTWTLQLSNVVGSPLAVGPRFVDPPVIGSSRDFTWGRRPNGDWDLVILGLGGRNNNFGARIEAVPEPATLTLLALGALGMGRCRR